MTPSAFAFDLYGTLLDFTSLRERVSMLTANAASFTANASPLSTNAASFVESWRMKQLQYAFTATLMGRYVDFDTLTAHALDYAAAQSGVNLGSADRADLLVAWSTLPAYPDVIPALAALQAGGGRLAVLSNGTPASIRLAVEHAGLTRYFEAQLSVDTVGAYKPRPEVYHLAVELFGLPRERIGFVSSNGWDATGAAEFGFTVYWCNRAGAPAETFGAPPARILTSLAELSGSRGPAGSGPL